MDGLGKFRSLQIAGHVHVSDTGVTELPPGCWTLLVMGPTGAGKSSFIEAIGWDETHRISSGQLDSFTQTMSTYLINNAVHKSKRTPVYIVDSPGFADTKTSEAEIVAMLRKWMDDHPNIFISCILYLIPITHARLPGSQRQVLKTIQALTGIGSAPNVLIITTMWDSIYGDRALKRAEQTFNQLRDEIWKEFIDEGSRIVKFHNTKHSALSNIDEAVSTPGANYFYVEDMVRESQHLHQTPFGASVYTDLQDRIQNLQSESANLMLELKYAKVQGEEELYVVLRQRHQDVKKDLARFQQQLDDFGPPPPVNKPDTPTRNRDDGEEADSVEDVLSEPPAASGPSSSPELSRSNMQRTPQIPRPHRGRVFRVMSSMKCWGKATRERQDDI